MNWYSRYLSVYEKPYDAVAYKDIIAEVRENFAKMKCDKPIATVSVIAYNEERHLLASLWALSNTKTKYPIEIVGINNNSTDRTEEIFKAVGLKYYNETQAGCGHARQCGLSNAHSKYHINADSDMLYPPTYVDTVVDFLESHPDYIGVSSTYSYLPDRYHSAFSIFLYIKLRDIYLWLQSFKRPELSVRGAMFSYHTKEAQKIGIRTHIIRGEDGALAFALRDYGKIGFIRNSSVKAMTVWGNGYGNKGGSILSGFVQRALQAFKNIKHVFVKATEYIDAEDNLIENQKKKKE